MRYRLAAALVLLAAAGCGARGDKPTSKPRAGDDRSASAQARIERCTERILRRVQVRGRAEVTEEQLRRYVERTCGMFEKHGLVYDDGTLRIEVYTDSRSSVCATSRPGEPARTVPCEDVTLDDPVLDCVLLHHVRRSEDQKYLAELRRTREVRCDD